jgi:hypothetical protein
MRLRQHGLTSRFHRWIVVLAALPLILTNSLAFGAAPDATGTDPAYQERETLDLPEARFGAVESFYRHTDAVEAGIGWERIIFEWRYLQPNGPDDWNDQYIPDEWLRDAKRGKRIILGLIKNAPHWATGSKLLGAVPKGIDLPIDDPDNLWAAFLKKLARYYSDKWDMHHWIIYNEPDIRPENTERFEFAGEVEDYYKMVKVAYKALKSVDPEAVIHLAGFTFWHDLVHGRRLYFERFLRLAAADPEGPKNNMFFDVMTVHVFAGTEWVWTITRTFKSLQALFGPPKPLWINEMNVRVTIDSGWPIATGEPKITLEEQASFIIQGAALGLAAGAERIQVYKFFDNDVGDEYEAWGLIRADGTRRPGYYALQTVSRYFNGITDARRYNIQAVTVVIMRQEDRTIYVIWNKTMQPLYARIRAYDREATDTMLISTTGKTRILPVGEDIKGSYELLLPPCTKPCMVQGEPRILIQGGPPQPVYALLGTNVVKVN